MTKKPQVTRSVHTLPFDKLSPDDFERLSLWLIMREGFQQVEHLGATGADRGQDIRAKRDNQLWVFQCKRVRTFTAKMAIAEIEKMLALPMEQFPNVYVFVTSCDLSLDARAAITRFAAGKFECRFWCATELDSMVKLHPDISAEFFAVPPLDITHFLAIPNRITSLASSPFSLHFSERRSRFIGRDNELGRLRTFAEDSAPLRWWAITGAAGSGKSRLALEFILRLPQGWLGGFLADPNSKFSWIHWKPIQPTLVVIDYASVLGERLPALLFDCLHTSATYTQPVRFLLLERSVTSVWWDGLHRFGPTRSAVVRARFDESPLHLETPSNDALFEIVRGASQGTQFSQDKANSLRRLLQSAAKPTPLHCQLLGMSEDSEGHSQVHLVKEAMDREYARWRSLGVDLQHRNACALATILSGLSSSELSRVLDTRSSIDPNIYAEMTGSYPKTELAPLEPDIFGESFVLDEIQDRNVWSNSSDLLNAAWNLGPSKTAAFAIRCVMDFPEHPAIRQLLDRERTPVEHLEWWVRVAIGCLFAYRGRSINFEEWRRIYNEIAAELSTSPLETTDHRPMELFLRKGFIFYCIRNERLLEAREALDTLLEMQIDVNSREAVEKTQIESITILLGSASFQDLEYAERMHRTIRQIASRAPPFATDICEAMKVLAWQMVRSGRLADAMAIVEEVEAIVDRDAEDLGTRRVHGELTQMMIVEYGKLGDLKSAAARLEAHFDKRATGPIHVDEQNVPSVQGATINGIPSILVVSCTLCEQYALSSQWDLAITEFRRAKSFAGISGFRSRGILGELLFSIVVASTEQRQLTYAVTLLNEFIEGDLQREDNEWLAKCVTNLLCALCDEAEQQEKPEAHDILNLHAIVVRLHEQVPANYIFLRSRAACAGRLATFMGEMLGETNAALSYLEIAAGLWEELGDSTPLEAIRTLQAAYRKKEEQ